MHTETLEVKHFWQEYRTAVLRQGVPQVRAGRFVQWVQRFARSGPDVPPRARTAAHVRAFLSDLGHQANVGPWQAGQAQEALQARSEKFFPLPWARAWPLPAHAPDRSTSFIRTLQVHDAIEEQWWEAELYRLEGALRLQLPTPDVLQAEACFQQALDVARSQQAKSLELRAALSLSRLSQQQGKRTAARHLLAPIYGWFTEGLDTAELQEAKALLDEWS
jgi:hypothetical protein